MSVVTPLAAVDVATAVTTFGTVLITATVTLTSVFLTRKSQVRQGEAARAGDLDRDLRATRITFYADFLDRSRRLVSAVEVAAPAGLVHRTDTEVDLGRALGDRVFDAKNDFNKALNAVILLSGAPVRTAAKRVEYIQLVCLRQRAFDVSVETLPSMDEAENDLIHAMCDEIMAARPRPGEGIFGRFGRRRAHDGTV